MRRRLRAREEDIATQSSEYAASFQCSCYVGGFFNNTLWTTQWQQKGFGASSSSDLQKLEQLRGRPLVPRENDFRSAIAEVLPC